MLIFVLGFRATRRCKRVNFFTELVAAAPTVLIKIDQPKTGTQLSANELVE
jgi:hypothetical protein